MPNSKILHNGDTIQTVALIGIFWNLAVALSQEREHYIHLKLGTAWNNPFQKFELLSLA